MVKSYPALEIKRTRNVWQTALMVTTKNMGLGSQLLGASALGKSSPFAPSRPSSFAIQFQARRGPVMTLMGGLREEVVARGSSVGEISLPSGDIY